MKPKRIYEVYKSHSATGGVFETTNLLSVKRELSEDVDQWRFRVIAARNKQIVGGSQEAFDTKSNAIRAARREVSLYPAGVAAVEVAG